MHRMANGFVVALGLFAAGCDDDDNPVNPSDTIREFTANLLPSNENPPIVPPMRKRTAQARSPSPLI